MKKIFMWLDDHRDPAVWLNGDDRMLTHEVVWVKNYDEFVEWIVTNGLPDFISFDHDLADDHYLDFHDRGWDGQPPEEIDYDSYKEMTGYHAAQWLVKHCDDNQHKLPRWYVHSANPDGAKNIRVYLENAKKHLGI